MSTFLTAAASFLSCFRKPGFPEFELILNSVSQMERRFAISQNVVQPLGGKKEVKEKVGSPP